MVSGVVPSIFALNKDCLCRVIYLELFIVLSLDDCGNVLTEMWKKISAPWSREKLNANGHNSKQKKKFNLS